MMNTEIKFAARPVNPFKTIVLEDKLDGQFADQHNKNLELTIAEAARRYIADPRGADEVYFPLPFIDVKDRRNGSGRGTVYIGLYSQEQVLQALEDLRAGKPDSALELDGTVRLRRHQKLIMRQTFGAPVAAFPTELTSLSGIKAHFLAKGARFSTKGRAWEDVVQQTLTDRGLKVQYRGSLLAGKDLQQKGDHVIVTNIPVMFW